MLIRDFVELELNYFRQHCNFTEDEMMYFNLRAKDKSNIYIAMQMNISEAQANKLSARVRKKILKVL